MKTDNRGAIRGHPNGNIFQNGHAHCMDPVGRKRHEQFVTLGIESDSNAFDWSALQTIDEGWQQRSIVHFVHVTRSPNLESMHWLSVSRVISGKIPPAIAVSDLSQPSLQLRPSTRRKMHS